MPISRRRTGGQFRDGAGALVEASGRRSARPHEPCSDAEGRQSDGSDAETAGDDPVRRRDLEQLQSAEREDEGEAETQRVVGDLHRELARDQNPGNRAEQQPCHRVEVDVALNEVAEPCHPGHRYASMSTSATSGRENSTGGNSPLPSISRTFVPDRNTCCSLSCGHVFADAIDPHDRHQKECSKNIGSMSSSCGSNSSKTSCASYVP